MKRILLSNDGGDGGGGTAPATPPASPKAVASTPIKHPAVIALEKKFAAMEDKVSGLEGWKTEVDTALEGLQVGAPPKPAPVAVKPGKVNAPAAPAAPATPATPPAPKSFLHETVQTIENDIWGAPKQG